MSRRRAAAGLAAALAVAGAVALLALRGEDSPPDETERFRARLDRICARADVESGRRFSEVFAAYADPGGATGLDEVVAAAEEVIEDSEETFAAFERIRPPAGLEEEFGRMLELQRVLLEEFEEVRDLAERRFDGAGSFEDDADALTERLQDRDLTAAVRELDELAQELGVERCAA